MYQITEKKFKGFYTSSEDFFVASVDEYINGRKKGMVFNFFQIEWEKDLWEKLEKTFDSFLFSLKIEEDVISILFFLLESVRYDKIFSISDQKNKIRNLISVFIHSKSYYFTNSHKMLLGLLSKLNALDFSIRLNKRKEFNVKKFFFKQNGKNFFEGKGANVKNLLNNVNFANYHSSIDSVRNIYDFFSKIGLVNFKVFWSKKPSRSLNNLLNKIFSESVERELCQFEKNFFQKKFPGELHSKNQNWCHKIKKNRASNLIKNAFVFGTGLINLGTKKYSYLYEVLIELEKIQTWTKFLVGSSFSLVNFENQKYYSDFWLLIENDHISDYLKGGILFGMGLNLKDDPQQEKFFIDKCKFLIKNKGEPAIKYGACLGLALSGIRTIGDPLKSETYRLVKNTITTDSLAGEGAALSIGLLFTGTSSSHLLEDVSLLIQEIEYERIRKTLVLSLGLVFLGRKDDSVKIFDKLILEKNPGIRQGAVFLYSLAFVGTGDIFVSKKLLKILTIDPDDNVKKATVIGLGFVFFSKFESIEKIFLQLIEHYNPFVRYGVCFGLFLSSYKIFAIEKIQFLLEKLSKDKIDFVRQGAFIALGLTFFGSTSSIRRKKTKRILKKAIEENLENNISKFGSYIGSALIELSEQINLKKVNNERYTFNLILGLFLFLNYWTWIPNLFFILLLTKPYT